MKPKETKNKQAKPPDGADKSKPFDVYGSKAALKHPDNSIKPKLQIKPLDDLDKLPTKPTGETYVSNGILNLKPPTKITNGVYTNPGC